MNIAGSIIFFILIAIPLVAIVYCLTAMIVVGIYNEYINKDTDEI